MQAELAEQQKARGLLYQHRRLARTLRPRLMGPEQRTVTDAGMLVAAAAQRLTEQALQDGGLGQLVRGTLALDQAETELARIAYSPGRVSLYGRLDGFSNRTGVKFVEYNADSAAQNSCGMLPCAG